MCSFFYSVNISRLTDCGPYVPLGMEDGSISGTQITASSTKESNHTYYPKNARLNGIRFWLADKTKEPHWLQVDFLVSVMISGIQIQGDSNKEWTKTIQVAYGGSENSLVLIKNGMENTVRKLFIVSILWPKHFGQWAHFE